MATVLDPAPRTFWPAWSASTWLMTYASLLGSALALWPFLLVCRQGGISPASPPLTFLTPVFALPAGCCC